MTEPSRYSQGRFAARFWVFRADGADIDPSRRYRPFDISGADPYGPDVVLGYADMVEGDNPELAADYIRDVIDPSNAEPQHLYATPEGRRKARTMLAGEELLAVLKEVVEEYTPTGFDEDRQCPYLTKAEALIARLAAA